MTLRIRGHAGVSDIGAVRSNNEDRWFADSESGLFIVADGLGGHAAGEVAAQRVVEQLPRLLQLRRSALDTGDEPRVVQTITAVVRALNRFIRQEGAAHPERHGMGSTVVLALLQRDAVLVANVGDCRAYLYRAGKLHLLSYDHSLAQYLIDSGRMAPDDPDLPQARRQLLQNLGMHDRPAPTMTRTALENGDRLLLCSDGLTDMVADDEIANVLRSEIGAQPACAALIDMANLAGGRDNVTVVVVDFGA